MVSQLTVYAKILCLLMTLFSAGASTGNDQHLQSACNLKFLRAKNGSVFADDNLENGQPQIFSVVATKIRDNRVAVTIYSKETNSYICFDKNWRTKAMRAKGNISKRCMFIENIEKSGAIRYRSVVNKNRSLGFQKNGKPIGPARAGSRKRPIDERCYTFNPSDVGTKHPDVLSQPPPAPPPSSPPPPRKPEANLPSRPQPSPSPSPPLPPQPRHRHHRQQDVASRKDASVGEANASGNSLLAAGPSPDQHRQSPTNRHRHKHGLVGRTGGGKNHQHQHQHQQAATGHPNLDTGASGAIAPTLSSLYGAMLDDRGPLVRAYGKGTHRRSHLNSYASAPGELAAPSLPAAIVTKLPPKVAGAGAPAGSGSLLLDVVGQGGLFRKEPANGRSQAGGGAAAAAASGRKKSAVRNAPPSSKQQGASTRGRDKRASG
uniref:Uncharacterized protein n=1 Tax=Anopheles gambiae TaxID=7165 RepID=A0A1S4H5V8_ANOGA